MSVGKIYKDEQSRYLDKYSKREIIQLTNYLGHSYQLYFTYPCWIDNNSAFIFKSERDNRSNYFRYELATGEIVQLTDFTRRELFQGSLSPATNCLYYWVGSTLYELKLQTLAERVVCEIPPPLRPKTGPTLSVTADGQYVCALLVELDPEANYSSSYLFELRPRTQIVRIHVTDGSVEVLHEERSYISHLNTSPTRSDLLTFCHEGPWEKVEQRIWGLNLDTQDVWAIRPQNGEYSVIAEHWFQDGEHLGFRSHLRATNDTRFGHIRFDNQDHVEAVVPYSRHYQSLDGSLVVGDGSPVYLLPKAGGNNTITWPYILLYNWDGDTYTPHILAYHGSTFNGKRSHPHPHITPDGKYVLFTTDRTDYSNIFIAPIGDINDLPLLDTTGIL